MRADAWLVFLQRAGAGESPESCYEGALRAGGRFCFVLFCFFGGGRVVKVRLQMCAYGKC